MNRELWQHQAQALDNLRATIGQGVKRIVLQAPTGAGKTLLAAAIVEGAQRKGNRMAFVVPMISLIDQTVEKFYEEGIREVGVIQADHAMTDWSKPVQICSVQTIKSRGEFPEAKVVVFDECHVLHETHRQWMAAAPDAVFLGLSATPWSKGLGRYFQTLLVAATTQELIDRGHLSKFSVFACPTADVSRVKVSTNAKGETDYVRKDLSEAMRAGSLTADIIQTWKERWGQGKTLVFATDRAHAETIHHRFQAVSVRSAYQDGDTSSGDRAGIKRDFHSGAIDVVVNIGTLTAGADWDVRCLVLARETKSEMLYVQIVGRGLRTAPGKDRLVMLDHTKSTLELGFVTDIHHEHLDDGKARQAREVASKAKPLPRPCPACASLTPRLARVCQDCGYRLPLASGVTERDGVLVELVPGQIHTTKGGKRVYSYQEKRQFHAELLGYARDRSKSEKWVLAQYRQKFDEWPARGWVLDEPIDPSFEVAQWVRSRLIAWAKSKRRLEAAE